MPLDAMNSELLLEAYQTWQGWCGARRAPTWRDVDLIAFPPALLPLMTVVDVLDNGDDYRYRYWGSQLTGLFGRDETGSLLSAHGVSRSGEIRMLQFSQVVREAQPTLFVTAFMKTQQVAAEKINLRLPVCDVPDLVSKIITLSTIKPSKITSPTALAEHLSEIWKNNSG